MTAPVEVVAELARRGETLATAESLTAGQLAGTVADVPGASAVLRGGLIVYAVDLKASLAGVSERLLAEHGPVHPEVARQLAAGARERCGATWGLATTGVAGPEPHGGQPAGTVYVGLAGPGVLRAERLTLPGDRAAVRAGTVAAALELLLRSLPAA
ncbi:competence protein [Actinocatenispora thailandica]|uniref:Competence protein n=1 Tax=Actinocatenispora thailandica TaxID=227318 RepID=A0A7R7HWA8_9ACTN|nr:CinA family protein [Actinocatenispora thailandica]BCJ34897.1 competence protein [Actinocatenispora thailandica]